MKVTAAEQLDAVREILHAISRSPFDIDGVLGIVVERAVKLCRSDYGYIFLPQADALYHLAAWHGGSPAQAEYERQHPTPATYGTIVGRVVLSGDVVQIEDVLADSGYQWIEGQRLGGFRTVLGVPMRTEDRLVGVFGLARLTVRPFTAQEINVVRTFADQAAIALENMRLLGTIERQRDELAGYLPSTVAELISTPGGEQLLAGHRREVTAVYCDLRGFTSFAEEAEPEEVFDTLREYHQEMGRIIVAHEGTLEHYAGDGMMIFLNDPPQIAEHTMQAVRMALAMRARFEELSIGWHRQGHELGLGIGIAVGFATLGRIGFEGHYGYAVIGSVANLAARLCGLALPGQILISGRVFARIEHQFPATPLGEVELKGFRRPVEAYDLIARAEA